MAWLKRDETIANLQIQNLQSQVELLQGVISDLREDKKQLMDRLDSLQNALVAKEAPLAYNDLKMQELDRQNPINEQQQKQQQEQNKFIKRYISGLEEDLFDSPDDMIDNMLKSAAPGFMPSRLADTEEA